MENSRRLYYIFCSMLESQARRPKKQSSSRTFSITRFKIPQDFATRGKTTRDYFVTDIKRTSSHLFNRTKIRFWLWLAWDINGSKRWWQPWNLNIHSHFMQELLKHLENILFHLRKSDTFRSFNIVCAHSYSNVLYHTRWAFLWWDMNVSYSFISLCAFHMCLLPTRVDE